MNMLRFLLSVLLIFITATAHAEEDRFCPSGDANSMPTTSIANWHAGAVTKGEPVMLRVAFDDAQSTCGGTPCFALGGVAGVEVRRVGSSVCVGVPQRGKLATMFGWIPVSRWHPGDSSYKPEALWVGAWQNKTAKIVIELTNGGGLGIRGHAIRDLGLGTGDIYGDFAISGRPQNGVLTATGDDGGCEVSVRLLGAYIVVADNGACGGMGVSFSGLYRFRYR
jgi:hypothetical protein